MKTLDKVLDLPKLTFVVREPQTNEQMNTQDNGMVVCWENSIGWRECAREGYSRLELREGLLEAVTPETWMSSKGQPGQDQGKNIQANKTATVMGLRHPWGVLEVQRGSQREGKFRTTK